MTLKIKGYNTYPGGKNGNGTYQTIINHIPPHDSYYSLFLGMCGVTRNIRPAKVMVLNDVDPAIISAWQSSNLPYNYRLHNCDALGMLKNILAEECGMISYAAINYDRRAPRLKPFIYLDPPYRMDSRKSQQKLYNFESAENTHVEMLSLISAVLQVNIMVSHYDDPLYNEILAGWNTHEFYSMTRQGLALEKIYYNYNLGDELHDYSYIGADFREREANNRIKRNFLKKLKQMEPRLRNSILRDLTAQ